jgi:pteridine reductase
MLGNDRLAGKVIAVTGGGQRLGAAIVRLGAQAGMRVALQYHRSQVAAQELVAELTATGAQVWAWQGDFTQPGCPEAFIDATIAHYGTLDVLVNNAGMWRATPIGQVTATDWDQLLTLNVTAAFATIQQATPMLTQTHGAVVNICDAGVYRPWRNYTPYLASKGALVTMTMALAKELAPAVRVNGVAPGLALIPDDWNAARIRQATQHIPLQTHGSARDIAEAVLFLAAAPFITGVILPVDGGVALRG